MIPHLILSFLLYFIPYETISVVEATNCIETIELKKDSSKFDFLKEELNQIEGASNLSGFYSKLNALENKQIQQVRIAHIGDSHIQADFLPGKLRKRFQDKFGNAGRGLIFPYQQAGTHSPIDTKSKSSSNWENKRSVFKKAGPRIGLSGMSIRTFQSNFAIEHYMKKRFEHLETFDKITTFHPNASNLYDIEINVGGQTYMPSMGGKYSRVYSLEKPTSTFILHGKKQNSSQNHMTIHGILLENTKQPGVLYNMIGVNGTTFFHYNRCVDFIPELQELSPDLIILSLGTNEALVSRFEANAVRREVVKLLSQIKQELPNTSILLSTLPDSFNKKKAPNENGLIVRSILIEEANKLEIAYWDLYNIMGGKGSMQDWVEKDLGFKDFIHFTQKGYELQADLLFEALMKGYKF